ncbi:dehydrogenase, FMN-dependent [Streptomyces ipomoeae 91-03]|uniref:Dehydrogenase, FMN-dependent n=4 Tax=Streptomyces ipomoeae TaxID=103232 RepID=L1KJY7_9ACTN|nr:dehydrogenase, FMN-dependent [Streptomyces ipomoeae 91-03]
MTAPADHATAVNMFTLTDYAGQARTMLSRGVWDFIEGGAGEERTLAANRAAFDQVRLFPRALSGTDRPSLSTTVLGRTWRTPLAVAPMAYHRLAHPAGEVATARAAGAVGVPLVVSTFASRTFEDIKAAACGPLWLQVYCFRDRSLTRDLVARAESAGFEALVLTVDAPILGSRHRDLRNRFRLPKDIGPVNLPDGEFSSPSDHARAEFAPALDWSIVEWLRGVSSLPVLVKGVLTASDARLALSAGAAGIVVSNHGGRQLDGAPATLDVLPEIAAAVAGACPVLLDSGVRRGSDILAALASGADGVLVGRPVLHGLAVAREVGAQHVLDILASELADAMILTGTSSTGDVSAALLGPRAPATPPHMSDVGTSRAGSGPLPHSDHDLRKADLHGSLRDPLLDTMTFLNEITDRYPAAVSFAPGRPYDGFFDTEDVFKNLRRYLDHLEAGGATPDQVRSALFQYGPTAGQIREVIADWLREHEDIDVPAESVVVTVGCQEAILLAIRALISSPQDVLLVSSPCYVGATGAARLLDAEVAAVPEGPEGLSCADLRAVVRRERARGRRPRAFYLVPDHANPSGATLPLATRRELLELAAREDILLLEDSPYRLVSPGERLPTLKSLDRDRRVVHLGSLAKTLFPGARVGFAVADQTVVDETTGARVLLADELAKLKSMVTVNTSPVTQAVVAGMLLSDGGRATEHGVEAAAHYGDAMRTVLEQLEAAFPLPERTALGVSWNRPSGGFFLTVTVPFAADEAALARSAEQFGVIWTPMSYFYPDGGGEKSLRLSVSYLSPPEIVEGIARLARFVTSCRAVPAASET